MIRKIMLILIIYSFFSCSIRQNNSEIAENLADYIDSSAKIETYDLEIFEDYGDYIDSLVRIDKYDIDIDFRDNNAFISKIFSSDEFKKEKFPSDLIGEEYFWFTDLFWGRTEEYNKKYQEFGDANFVKYRDEHLNENNDYSKVAGDFNILRYEAVGYPDIKNVCIAYTKDDLNFIETNYINLKYLQEISENYFEDNILVLISFSYGSPQYLKDWKIINENNKYVFTVEMWKRIYAPSIRYAPVGIAYRILFLINIKK
jgi:hypothetical protein